MPKIIISLARMVITVGLIVTMFDHLNFVGIILVVVVVNLLFDYAVGSLNA